MSDDDSSSDNEDFEAMDTSDAMLIPTMPEIKRFDTVLDDLQIFFDLSSKSKEHMAMLKKNFYCLVCARVGISITESESTMKDEDIWFMCYDRFMETINNLNVQSNVEFIFNHCEELDFPPEVDKDLKAKANLRYPPKLKGLNRDKIRAFELKRRRIMISLVAKYGRHGYQLRVIFIIILTLIGKILEHYFQCNIY